MTIWKRIVIMFWITFYRIIYFKRYQIHYGRMGNRVEISLRKLGCTHKFFISQGELRTIKV